MAILAPPGPIDLAKTLAAVGVREWHDGAAWWPVDTASGPGTIAMRPVKEGVEATGWGSGAGEAMARVPRLLGFDDDPEAFDAGSLRELHREAIGLRLGSTGAVFDALITAILGQVVTNVEAKRSERRIRAAFGAPAPGPQRDLRLPPAPDAIASLGYQDLHRFGVERKRAQVLIEAARRARRLDEILEMGREDAYRRLTAVRGIGAWTAAMVMGQAWGDRDAVPVGDHNLPSVVTWALRGQRKGTDTEMLELLEPYRPNRRRAIVLLKQGGVHPPRHGPKSAVRKHL